MWDILYCPKVKLHDVVFRLALLLFRGFSMLHVEIASISYVSQRQWSCAFVFLKQQMITCTIHCSFAASSREDTKNVDTKMSTLASPQSSIGLESRRKGKIHMKAVVMVPLTRQTGLQRLLDGTTQWLWRQWTSTCQ